MSDLIQFGESQQTMSSLEIAKLTGKPHNDVLKAIRAMEPAWEKIAEGNFSRGSYKDANNQERPCFFLTTSPAPMAGRTWCCTRNGHRLGESSSTKS